MTRMCFAAVASLVLTVPALAQTAETIVVTARNGARTRLHAPRFEYSKTHENYFRLMHDGHGDPDYLEVQGLVGDRRRIAWIHYSQIKTATFDQNEVVVTLDRGAPIRGRFPDAQLRITGKTRTGDATFNVGDVKSMEFPFFTGVGDPVSKTIVSRESFAREWSEGQLRGYSDYGCLIADGARSYRAKQIWLWDSYASNYIGTAVILTAFHGHPWRVGNLSDYLTLERSTEKIKIDSSEMRSLRITGKRIGDKPEVTLERRDGKRFTLGLVMAKKMTSGQPDTDGAFDEDDALAFPAPYGWDGLSLAPLRTITVTCDHTR